MKTPISKKAKQIWQGFPRWLRRSLRTLLSLWLVFWLSGLFFPLKVQIEYAQTVTDSQGQTLHAFLSYDDKWRMKLPEEEISQSLEKAILFKEDRYFHLHPGINPFAIVRALYRNSTTGRRTSGASTITMQLARLLEPKQRTYGNKLIEVYRALQLEWHYSKSEILTLYLNLVPYGSNIEGIKSASELYFRKAPTQLSLAEIATLVVIPNQPTSLSLDRSSEPIVEARNRWLQRFQEAGLFPVEDIRDALDEPLPDLRRKIPRKAPHLARRLRQNQPEEPVIVSTLQSSLQAVAEQLVRDHVRSLYSQGIRNAAAIVIDNADYSVAAYVGSADFFNNEDGGQVDGVKAVRAPGSTLKPLLYGLAMDEGLITGMSPVLDVPTAYGTYEPENYNGDFKGKVTVKQALAQSLNVPAVRLLHELSPEFMVRSLSAAGFRQIESDVDKLGLSLVLGGCGASLEELTQLYAAFAKQGTLEPIRFLKNESPKTAHPVLSPGASYMITQILTELSRPDLPIEWHTAANLPKVAWKTGTSYGRKDAWSIGYNPEYTVGIWVGNFSGEGVPGLYGAGTAAPLLFKLFNQMPRSDSSRWFEIPASLQFREVCSESGDLPEDFCENRALDLAIAGISPHRKCTHMSSLPISADSSISYCTHCLPDSGYTYHWYPNFAPELMSFFHQQQIAYREAPVHNPNCERVFASGSPQITSPVNGLEYLIPEGEKEPLMLSCDVANGVKRVYWYMNDKFMGSMPAREPLFISPPPGEVKISCSDDKGRNTDVFISVRKAKL